MDAERIVELKLNLSFLSQPWALHAGEYIEELEQRCDRMSAYLSTHDHTLHDAAMAAAREHLKGNP